MSRYPGVVHRAFRSAAGPAWLVGMEVSPSLLRRTGGALFDVAAQVRRALGGSALGGSALGGSALGGSALRGDRTGPGDPDWATDAALHAQACAWDGYLSELAARLDDAGDRLTRAADGYADADDDAWRRLC